MSVDAVLENIIKYKPDMKKFIEDPSTRAMLEQEINTTYQKYAKVTKFAKLIDNVDRKTAVIKSFLSIFGLPGKLVASALDFPELVAKGIYGAYYTAKTGDLSAMPGWAVYEGISYILPFGNLLDLRDTYKRKVKKSLDKIVAEKTVDKFLAKVYGNKKDEEEKMPYRPVYQPA